MRSISCSLTLASSSCRAAPTRLVGAPRTAPPARPRPCVAPSAAPTGTSGGAAAAQPTEAAGEPMVTVMLETPAGAVSKWEIESDVNLRQMIKDTGEVEMYHGMWAKSMNCGGGGSCGTCVVQVLEDKDGLLSERNEIEGKKLKGKPDSFRLACQTWVGDGTNSGTCKARNTAFAAKAHMQAMARQAWAVDKSSYLERLRINSADHVWAVELEGTAMACYAVCDCERHNGAVWLKRDKIVHVYACPLKFAPQPSADNTAAVPANGPAAAPPAADHTAAVPADDPAAALPAADDTAALPAAADDDADAAQSAASQYLYICDCDGMSRVGEKLAHLGGVSSMTRSECIDELGGEGAFCQHSVALATLIAERRVPDPGFTGSILPVADLIAVPCDVPVTVLESSPSPLLSCAFTEEGPTVPATRVVIGVKKHTFVCFTCPEHLQARCDRVRMLHELTTNLKADVGVGVLDDHHFAFDPPQRDGVDSDGLIDSVSYETIPELIVNQVFKDRVGASDAPASLPKACIPPAEGSPSRPTCECGAPWGNETVEVSPSGGAAITHEWTTKRVKVCDRCCSSYPSCPGRLPYDGQPDAVFNLSNHSLFAYEVMHSYFSSLGTDASSFACHYHRVQMYHRQVNGVHSLLPSRKTFRRALKAFMRLLRVEHVFECPCCKQLPHSKRIIIMDGTCLGVRRDLFRFLGLPTAHGGVVPICGPLRKARLQYCASGTVGDLTAAIKLARCPGNPRALPLFLERIKAEGAAKYDPYRRLLKAVSIDYPLLFVPP
ncbi:hypothetical protein FOA52_008917 [Chlamydomonas sp. UWO 241]|nr:hypothetical protein FOA52_008917 [Chlamydomonas sp. UWO 241]